jgi:hypothetical protein
MRATSSVLLLVSTFVLNLVSIACAQQPASTSHTAVLATKRMCCAHESVPAIKELSRIPGVARVLVNHKTRSLTIIPKENAFPSPLAIWEAAERTNLEPIRLSTAHGVYNGKPQR